MIAASALAEGNSATTTTTNLTSQRSTDLPVNLLNDSSESTAAHKGDQGDEEASSTTSDGSITQQVSSPHRRLRSRSYALEELAQSIVSGKRVLFVTGAGLSVASGVQPFRSGGGGSWQDTTRSKKRRTATATRKKPETTSGLWDEVVWTTATRDSFRQAPERWYREFWYPHFAASQAGLVAPNQGHVAMEQILQTFRKCRQITQNIDGLQTDPAGKYVQTVLASEPFVVDAMESDTAKKKEQQLIEIHGRVGLYKCLPSSDSDTDEDSDDEEDRPVHLGHRRKARVAQGRFSDPTVCPFQYFESLTKDQLLMDASNCKIPPRCPYCNNIVMPQALLFDEGYHSHSYYQFETAEQWLADCDVMVFCGTSFAVRLTSVALDRARDANIPVYNFNVCDSLTATSRLNASNILGPAVETLPQLWRACEKIATAESEKAEME